jgi:hypothetical protein
MRVWVVSAAIALALSAAAVAFVTMAPSVLAGDVAWRVVEAFASPGELLWWASIGGSFAGYPTGASGYFIWTLGTAVFWFIAASPLVLIAVHLRKARRRW